MTIPTNGEDADIQRVLESYDSLYLGKIPHDSWLRDLLRSAWEYGYTTGMADSAKLESIAAEKHKEKGTTE